MWLLLWGQSAVIVRILGQKVHLCQDRAPAHTIRQGCVCLSVFVLLTVYVCHPSGPVIHSYNQ